MKLKGRPNSLLRWMMRLPQLLAALGLLGIERFVGAHWMIVTVTGRKTGRPRTVALDLLAERDDGLYVDSGWLESQWVKNLRADPRVTIRIDRRTFQAIAEELSAEAGADVYLDWVERRGWAARTVLRFLSIDFTTPEATRRGLVERASVWAFRTQNRTSA